ncbi:MULTISPECIES: DUF3574 domain-containing protein [unclassified Streptomyces]|uniref:DUF3574 domain-containing protein n=1 Tax=unclassified Streptomyces TaxID=2593676 RepID=UPI0004BF0CDB|nr:DUF3574 domain-containing protein [Streptomyces sp. NRRL S-87]
MTRFSKGRALAVGGALVGALVAGGPAAYGALAGEDTGRGQAYVETHLYFGTQRSDGGPAVTDPQFMDFMDRRVTPAFPEGLTLQQGRGQWRNAHGVIERERSYELLLLYPAAEAKVRDQRIEAIREAYQREYAQESVGRADDRTRVDF